MPPRTIDAAREDYDHHHFTSEQSCKFYHIPLSLPPLPSSPMFRPKSKSDSGTPLFAFLVTFTMTRLLRLLPLISSSLI